MAWCLQLYLYLLYKVATRQNEMLIELGMWTLTVSQRKKSQSITWIVGCLRCCSRSQGQGGTGMGFGMPLIPQRMQQAIGQAAAQAAAQTAVNELKGAFRTSSKH